MTLLVPENYTCKVYFKVLFNRDSDVADTFQGSSQTPVITFFLQKAVRYATFCSLIIQMDAYFQQQ